MFFTVSAPRPIQSISCDVSGKLYFVCVSDHSERFLKFLLLPFTKVLCQNYQLQKYVVHKSNEMEVVSDFAILRTILLWIVRELAREGSVAVAVGVNDMWQVTGDTCVTWHVTWCLTHEKYFLLIFLSVLLTAHVKRFSVSRMRDFFWKINTSKQIMGYIWLHNIYLICW